MLFTAGSSSIKDMSVIYRAFAKINVPNKIIMSKTHGFEGLVATWAFYNGKNFEIKLPPTNDYFDQQNLDREIIFDVDVTDVLLITTKYLSSRLRYIYYYAMDKGIKVNKFTIQDLYNA